MTDSEARLSEGNRTLIRIGPQPQANGLIANTASVMGPRRELLEAELFSGLPLLNRNVRWKHLDATANTGTEVTALAGSSAIIGYTCDMAMHSIGIETFRRVSDGQDEEVEYESVVVSFDKHTVAHSVGLVATRHIWPENWLQMSAQEAISFVDDRAKRLLSVITGNDTVEPAQPLPPDYFIESSMSGLYTAILAHHASAGAS